MPPATCRSVATTTPLRSNSSSALASTPVTLKIGDVSLVMSSPTVPESLPGWRTGTVGAAGGVLSIVTCSGGELIGLASPEASICSAV